MEDWNQKIIASYDELESNAQWEYREGNSTIVVQELILRIKKLNKNKKGLKCEISPDNLKQQRPIAWMGSL